MNIAKLKSYCNVSNAGYMKKSYTLLIFESSNVKVNLMHILNNVSAKHFLFTNISKTDFSVNLKVKYRNDFLLS